MALSFGFMTYGIRQSRSLRKRAHQTPMMALAGHMTREMLEHYSHVRMAAKREALEKLSGGLMKAAAEQQKAASQAVN